MNANLLRGEKVHLTALNPDDLPTIARWQEHSDYQRLFDASPAYPRSIAQLTRWLEGEQQSRDVFLFAVHLLDGDNLIGYLDISGIIWSLQVGWLGIGIGDPQHRGKGYGYDASRLALKFAFHEINLHRLQLTVFSYNTHAIALYEKLGFLREGAYREFLHRDGQRYDMLLYGLLRREWEPFLKERE
jgi:RimJ/RimL family protein N-acetyltransferase